MLAEAIVLATAFEVLPFYEQREDYQAVRPFYAREAEATDVLWPLWTSHRDWWRCCFFAHYQENREGGYQFDLLPIFWMGRERAESETYWGLFPFYGYHPHELLLYDFNFCLWPIYQNYRQHPRELESTSALFPIFHYRSDGSWGVWPLAGTSHNRSDDAAYFLWPIFNWKNCHPDRDTAGAGSTFMCWPLFARIDREREQSWQFLPPFFSYTKTPQGSCTRLLWPIVDVDRFEQRKRMSVFPLIEREENFRYYDHASEGVSWRFGWRLVEVLPEETRVFPFWVSRKDDSYFRFWPFYERSGSQARVLSLFPIRWVDAVDRNWAKFWTFYEREESETETQHSLFWGIFRWKGEK